MLQSARRAVLDVDIDFEELARRLTSVCGSLAGALWGGGRVAPPRLGRRHKKKGDGGSGRPATLHAAVRIVPGDGCGRPEFGGAAVPVHGPVGVAWRRENGGV